MLRLLRGSEAHAHIHIWHDKFNIYKNKENLHIRKPDYMH